MVSCGYQDREQEACYPEYVAPDTKHKPGSKPIGYQDVRVHAGRSHGRHRMKRMRVFACEHCGHQDGHRTLRTHNCPVLTGTLRMHTPMLLSRDTWGCANCSATGEDDSLDGRHCSATS